MKKHVRSRAAFALALTGFAGVAGCRGDSTLVTGETTTTGAEVERRQPELPVIPGTTLTGVAERAGEGAAAGAMSNAPAGATETTSPGGPTEPAGKDPLDANQAPPAGPERVLPPTRRDAGY